MKTLCTVFALLLAVAVAGAAEQQVWIPGHWQADRSGERVWQTGYYTTAVVAEPAPVAAAPQPVWVDGRWIWQNQAWVWQAGHWELPAQAVATVAPAPTPVVVERCPPPVVVVDSCPPPVYVEACPRPGYYDRRPVYVDSYRPRSHVDVVVGAPLPLPPLIHGSIHGHGFMGLPGLPPIPTPHELHKLFH